MGLGQKVRETLVDAFEPIVGLLMLPVKLAIEWGLEALMDLLGERFAPTMAPLVKTLEDTGQVPPELQPIIDEIKNPQGEIASLLSFAAARGGLGAVTGGVLGTLTAGLDYSLKAAIQPSILDVKSIIDTERRVAGSQDFCNQEWLWSGFNTSRRDYLREITRPLMGLQELAMIYNRFPGASQYVDRTLEEYGFKTADINYLKLTFAKYPGLQDLITMAVREAFSPEIISKYELGADFPEEFAAEAERQGLSRQWAERYWYAHWNLPSIGQGFEMLHRGLINREDLDVLLRTQDVMPFWRENIVQIAYNPLTRVDVRRMHALGVLDREQVKKAYKDVGYNDYNAELMTRFTEQYNQLEDRELTKTEILQLYRKGTFTSDEALEFLGELGYDPDTAAWLLEEQAAAAGNEARDLSMTQVKKLYLAGAIEKGEATGRLAELGYQAEDIEKIYALWELEAEPNIRLPSRTDLESFWKALIIDDDTWFNYMLLLGYTEEVIVWYYLEMSESKQ